MSLQVRAVVKMWVGPVVHKDNLMMEMWVGPLVPKSNSRFPISGLVRSHLVAT